jgi:hypothetical protein
MAKDDSSDPCPPPGSKLRPVKSGEEDVYVQVPAEAGEDTEDSEAEAAHYLETLRAHDRVAGESEPLGEDQTHRIETDEEGRKRLRRKRFSAV